MAGGGVAGPLSVRALVAVVKPDSPRPLRKRYHPLAKTAPTQVERHMKSRADGDMSATGSLASKTIIQPGLVR